MIYRTVVVISVCGLLSGCAEESDLNDGLTHAPVVEIDFPPNDSVFRADQDIELAGYIDDADGLDTLRHISWHSEIDGTLAVGDGQDIETLSSIYVRLSPGQHRVWLIAVDETGNGRSQEIDVAIIPSDH